MNTVEKVLECVEKYTDERVVEDIMHDEGKTANEVMCNFVDELRTIFSEEKK